MVIDRSNQPLCVRGLTILWSVALRAFVRAQCPIRMESRIRRRAVGGVTCPADRVVCGYIIDLFGCVVAIFKPSVEGPRGSLKNAASAERAAQVGVHRKFYCGQVHDRADWGFVVCGRIVVMALETASAARGFVVDEFAVGEVFSLKGCKFRRVATTTILSQIKSTTLVRGCIIPVIVIQYLPCYVVSG